MNKIITSIFISLFFISAYAQTLTVGGTVYNIDTLENHQVVPATQYVALRLTTAPAKRLDVYFLKTDLTNPYVDIRATIGRDSIYGGEGISTAAKRKSKDGLFYFAGTNGDFYETALPYVGYPVSGNIIDGQIAKIPGSRNVFVMSASKVPDIGVASYSGNIKFGSSNWAIHSVNHLRNENKLVLYNEFNGKVTRTNSYGTEVLVELLEGQIWGTNKTIKAKVLKVEKNIGSMAIPKGKAVLSGHGTSATQLNNLSVNDEIDIKFSLILNSSASNFTQMTGGDNYKTMLLNGVVEQTNVWNERHPRTGLGYSQKKDKVIFCVVDGRGVSLGATTLELAELMKSAGAYTAFNMDGGGSSTMYVAEYGKAVNTTSDGNERAVANGIFAVSTAPADNVISMIKPYKSTISLPQFGEYQPKFYGYNQYGVLLSADVQGVVLTCPSSLGIIDGDKFVATGTTSGNITATYNGISTATISVTLQAVANLKIRLDSVIVDNRTDYPIEVIATTSGGDALISPDALSWTVTDTEICKIENGIVKALKNGKTMAQGQIGSVTDEIQINVEIPSAATIIGDSMSVNKWTLAASSFLNAQLNQSNLPSGWDHGAAVNFLHAAGRSPYIRLTNQKTLFGIPDTVKMVMNIGNMALTEAIFYLKANNDTKTTSYKISSFEANKDFNISIPVDALFDISDRAVFPIKFDNVNFYINTSGMTESQPYTLAIKDLLLVYKDFVVSALKPIKSERFAIYPNPVNNKILNIRLSENNSQNVHTEIYNVSGQLLMSTQHGVYKGNSISIAIKDFSSGMYLLKVYENNQSSITKFVVD